VKRAKRRPSLRRVLFYAWTALVVANLGLLAAFTLPRTLEERNLELRAARLNEDIEAARRRNQALKTRDEAAARNAADMARFYRTVVGTREQTLLPVLAEIQAAARDLQLATGSQSYEAKALDDAPLVRFRIRMPVSGSYGQVTAFLDRLEQSALFLTIDEVKLRERPQDGAGAADLNLSFSAYFRDTQPRPARKGGKRAS
jgi:Tfp pilus assembly protein PilN